MTTFLVSVPDGLSNRALEAIDNAVYLLRDVPGVVVDGWCDEEDQL